LNRKPSNHTHDEVPTGIHPEIPEQRRSEELSDWWVGGWMSPILVTLFTIIWALLIYRLIGDRPTDWKYGIAPYVPGQSIFTSQPVQKGTPPKQVEYPGQKPGGMHGM